MPRYFNQKITTEDLAKKIKEAWENNRDFEEWDDPDQMIDKPDNIKDCLTNEYGIGYSYLTQSIEKDLSKVDFDCENATINPTEFNVGRVNKVVGFNELSNGLSYLGVLAGGDWEFPVFFALYFDGNKLRGYIPNKGNVWNNQTKAALGNYEKEDQQWLTKNGFKSKDDVKLDQNKIEENLLSRIQYQG
jgi:hypothetical protein